MTPDELRPVLPALSPEAISNMAANASMGVKPWWQSRAIWGALIVFIAQLARLVEIDVDVEGMTDAALSIATLVGAVLAWYGRLQATRPVSRTQVLPGVRAR